MKGHIRECSPGHWAIVIDARDSQGGKRKPMTCIFDMKNRAASSMPRGGNQR
jgi:hypothetical protein